MLSEKIHPKILIADDDPSCADQIFHILKKSYQIHKADSGIQAIEFLFESSADILITDMYMGDMTGLELMKNALQINPDILTIAITGQGDIDLAIEFMKCGGIDFLQKPIDKYHIIRAVESASNRYHLIKENRQLREISEELGKKFHEEVHRRLNIQESLRETEQQYQNIFENAPVGIFQSSSDGRFMKVNPAMAKIFGYSSPVEFIADSANTPHQLYVIPQNGEKIPRKLPGQNRWVTFEHQFYKKDKTPVFIRNTVRLVHDQNGHPICFEGFNIDITEESKQKELLHLEMSRAKELYDLVLVPQLPALKRLGIRVRYIPAEIIGGDILELYQIDENNILIFLADVTGHGIPAAMTANTLKIHFKEIAQTESDPMRICGILNSTMNRLILKDDIIAAFCARINVDAMYMTYCLCGIPTPLILRKGEKIRLEPTAPPLGVFEDMVMMQSKMLSLEKDDAIVAFTDGITDVISENKGVFGMQGVTDNIENYTPHLIEDILDNVIRFQKTDKFNDDIIILTLSVGDNVSESLWNVFSAPDRLVLKLRTCYMNIDRCTDFVMNQMVEKFDIPQQSVSKIKIAFFELLMNAVEHGNLEMTHFKRDLRIYDSDMYDAIFIERLSSDAYGNRLIEAELARSDNYLKISIRDGGLGFCVENSERHLSEQNIEKPEGRGIRLAKLYADRIKYNKKGNEVALYVCLD